MILGFIGIVASLLILVSAERCKRNPETCKKGFMHPDGYTRSLVALWYFIGKPKEAQEAIVKDENLRKKFVIEGYLWALLCFIGSLILIATS